jgi:hypothetical protein
MAEVNLDHLNGLTAEIEGAIDCAALQAAALQALAGIQSQIDDITAQLAVFAPYLELLTLPTDPLKVLEYLKKLVDTLIEPIIKPIIGFQLQLVAYAAAFARLIDAIQQKAASFTTCSIALPAPPVLPVLPDLPVLQTP